MMKDVYSVKQLANLSGVTVRTLHHYDKIGLLKPSQRSEAGYRKYGEAELLRLQQVLFYRELGIQLSEIKEILDDPEFDLIAALKAHKTNLKVEKKRLTLLLKTIDQTIVKLNNDEIMKNPEELYNGLPKEGLLKEYREQAVERYGKDTVRKSENYLSSLSKDDFKKLVEEQQQNMRDLSALFLIEAEPEDDKVQKEISEHYRIVRLFWGTAGTEDPQLEAYKGLGDLYLSDERFCQIDGKPNKEYAQFMKKALHYFATNYPTS